MTSASTAGASTAEAGTSLASEVLELVRSRSKDAEAEVEVRSGQLALTRFANSFIHQNVAEDAGSVAIRLALDGRVASARLDGPTDRERLERLVGGVFDAARVSPVDPDWPGVTGPAPAPEVEHWDAETATASADDRARRVAAFVAAAGGLETAGSVSTQAVTVVCATTAGQALAGRTTIAAIDGIARTPTSDGVARHASVALGSIDGRAAGARAVGKARAAADPTDMEPGRYPVVLEPSCVANILTFLQNHGYGGRVVEEHRSFVRLGEAQLDPSITIRQDIGHPLMVGLPFDVEGTPRLAIDVVRDGVSLAVLHDRRSARKAGVPSTGNAVEGPNSFGFVAASTVLLPGDRNLDALVGDLERGILVSDFWYTRVLDPRTLVVTGLTRNGVWLIENGRVVRPLRNLRFTQSYAEALAPGAVLGVGSDLGLFPEGHDSAQLVPSLHLASWNFTGGAKG
ncbi:MAG TPA: metallopeptidase TldD-related protein [Candidatus Limnocylindrales bacterium]|nr:metallopeptidase TldD-related protein [Candidatus Limnocylindrales bacterium]